MPRQARSIEEDAAMLLRQPPLPIEMADRERLLPFVASRLRMGSPPSDIEVTLRALDTVLLHYDGRAYQVVLARSPERDK